MQAATRAREDDWDRHWNAQAAANALNPAQVYRKKLVLEALALRDTPGSARVLELGSGSGEFAQALLRAHPVDVVGLDLSDVAVEIARRKVPAGRFFQQDFTQPMRLDDSFRGWAKHVVFSEVHEHLDDPVAALRNVRPFLAPGCRVVITVPGGPMSAFDKHIGHRRHFDARLLRRTLRDAGLDVAELRGAGFPFFNLYRMAVIARGEKLIEDVRGEEEQALPPAGRAAVRVFSWLFKLNTSKTQLGWQLVAVGREPS